MSLGATVVQPVQAADLGVADLSPQQMSQSFPSAGTRWKAFCGTYDVGKECEIELGTSELIVDSSQRVPYKDIFYTESRDAYMAITRIAKVDPLYTGWDRYRRVNNVRFFNNTVLISYKSTKGGVAVALFSFPENRVSDWYGLANAMRMISLGAIPSLPAAQ